MNWKELNYRYSEMRKLASYLADRYASRQEIRLLFVCTHNSRRSQIARAIAPFIWRQLAPHPNQSNVMPFGSYSGGSEVTFVHPNTVSALLRAGFREIENSSSKSGSIQPPQESVPEKSHPEANQKDASDAQMAETRKSESTSTNSVYRLQDPEGQGLELFSKLLDHPENPGKSFAAIMVCSNADEACPNVAGADVRISLPFEDPGRFDNTAQSDAAYDSALSQIARDLYSVFSMAQGISNN